MAEGSSHDNVVLVGFMAAGKSTVGRLLARRLGRPFVDLDDVVESLAGCSIPELFARGGEEGFRQAEARAVEHVASQGMTGHVIAAGGGTLERGDNAARLTRLGQLVWLYADLQESLARAARDGAVRPLLQGLGDGGPHDMAERYRRRRWQYAACSPVWVDTRGVPPEEVVDRVLRALQLGEAAPAAGWVLCGRQSYPIYSGPGVLQAAARLADLAGMGGGPLLIVADRAIAASTGLRLRAGLASAGAASAPAPVLVEVGPGEKAKRLSALAALYTKAIQAGVDRGWGVLALGGGATLDSAGFFAATYMRGLRWMALPTTLLAQVDASIGGKTAINHPLAKNAVGAFHQPVAVLADPSELASLPSRELRSGMAEVVKHALIEGAAFLADLESRVEALPRTPPSTGDMLALIADGELVRRAARVKAVVVSEDPYEAGLREVLNLGHTTAHALEALSGFSRLRHGEAVAIGMVTALLLSRAAGLLQDPSLVERVVQLLGRLGLPVAPPEGVSAEAVWEAASYDKKNRRGQRRWVLVRAPGELVVAQGQVDREMFFDVWRRQARLAGAAGAKEGRLG